MRAMSQGLFALLDDIAAIAKIAAASLDDAAGQAVKASGKAAGVVIDDAAVTPKYVVGFTADREIPIIVRIAKGSIKTKLLMLLPGALLLSAVAPWALNPLLILGGAYLSFEGFEKILEFTGGHGHGGEHDAAPTTATALEDQRVTSALRTDIILSAEIMAITLASVAESSLPIQAIVLAVVGVLITIGVYGVVALIVKADDFGVILARRDSPTLKVIGRGLVTGMPSFLRLLSLVGVFAMLWVGGGIVLHSLAGLGAAAPEHFMNDVSTAAGAAVPATIAPAVDWAVGAGIAAVFGVVIGLGVFGVMTLFKRLRG